MQTMQASLEGSPGPQQYQPYAPQIPMQPVRNELFTDDDNRHFIQSLNQLIVFAIGNVKNRAPVKKSFSLSFSWRTCCTSIGKVLEHVRTDTIPITPQNILRFSRDQLAAIGDEISTWNRVRDRLQDDGIQNAIVDVNDFEKAVALTGFLGNGTKKEIVRNYISQLSRDITTTMNGDRIDVSKVEKSKFSPGIQKRIDAILNYFSSINRSSLKLKMRFFMMFDIVTEKALLNLLIKESPQPLMLVCEFLLAQMIKTTPVDGDEAMLLFLLALEKRSGVPIGSQAYQIHIHFNLCINAILEDPEKIESCRSEFLKKIQHAYHLFCGCDDASDFLKKFDPLPRSAQAKDLARAILAHSSKFKPQFASQSRSESPGAEEVSKEGESSSNSWW